jgi:hypothetical protein
MAKQQKDKEVTVVAEFEISSSEGTEKIKTFCAAWVRAWQLPTPVAIAHVGWVRKD